MHRSAHLSAAGTFLLMHTLSLHEPKLANCRTCEGYRSTLYINTSRLHHTWLLQINVPNVQNFGTFLNLNLTANNIKKRLRTGNVSTLNPNMQEEVVYICETLVCMLVRSVGVGPLAKWRVGIWESVYAVWKCCEHDRSQCVDSIITASARCLLSGRQPSRVHSCSGRTVNPARRRGVSRLCPRPVNTDYSSGTHRVCPTSAVKLRRQTPIGKVSPCTTQFCCDGMIFVDLGQNIEALHGVFYRGLKWTK